VERWRLSGKESGGGVGGSLRPGLRAPGGVIPSSPGGNPGADWLTSPGRERGTSHSLFAGRAPATALQEEDEDEAHRGEGELTHDALEARRGSSPPPPILGGGASAPDALQMEARAVAVALRKAAEAQRAAEEEARRENEVRAERERAEQKRIIREARDRARAEALAATQVALEDAKRKAQEEAAQRAEAERRRQADAAFAALVEAQRRDNLAASAAAAVQRESSELARREAERAKQAEWEAQRETERQQKVREQELELAAAAARREADAKAALERREQLASLQTSGPGAAEDALSALAAAKAKAAQTRGAFDTAFESGADEDAMLRAAFGAPSAAAVKQQPPPAVRVKTPPASPPTLAGRNGGSPAGGSRPSRLGPPPTLSLDSAPTSPSRAQPDKYAVAAVGADTRLRLWMVPRLGLPPVTSPTSVKEGHTDEVKAVCLLSDGCLVTGGRDAHLRVWPRGGGCSTVPSPGGTIFSICALPSGGCVTACSDTTLRLWLPTHSEQGAPALACRHQLAGHKNMVFALDITPDGVRLVSGSADKTARLWRLDTLPASPGAEGIKSVRTLSGHTAWVNAVKLYDGATRCATGSADGQVRLWRCSSGECIAICSPQAAQDTSLAVAVLALAVLADTQRIAAAYDDGRLCVWNQEDGSLHAKVENAHKEAVRAITALPDGRIATGGDDRLIKLWREERGGLVCDGSLTGDITSDSIFAITHC
jgi:WD40 repeat protein